MDSGFDPRSLSGIPDPFADDSRVAPPVIDLAPAQASPTRSERRRWQIVAACAAVVYEAGWVLFVERRPDLARMSWWTLALELALPLISVAIALTAAVRRGRSGLGLPSPYLITSALLTPLFFGAGEWLIARETLRVTAAGFWRSALVCIAVTGLLAAGPLVLGAFAFRRAFASSAIWRTAALGVACGALAASTMSVVCSDESAAHVLLAHGSWMFIGGLSGALLARHVSRA